MNFCGNGHDLSDLDGLNTRVDKVTFKFGNRTTAFQEPRHTAVHKWVRFGVVANHDKTSAFSTLGHDHQDRQGLVSDVMPQKSEPTLLQVVCLILEGITGPIKAIEDQLGFQNAPQLGWRRRDKMKSIRRQTPCPTCRQEYLAGAKDGDFIAGIFHRCASQIDHRRELCFKIGLVYVTNNIERRIGNLADQTCIALPAIHKTPQVVGVAA